MGGTSPHVQEIFLKFPGILSWPRNRSDTKHNSECFYIHMTNAVPMTPNQKFVVLCVERACVRMGIRVPVLRFYTLGQNYQACTIRSAKMILFDWDTVERACDYDLIDIVIHECCHLKNRIRGHGIKFTRACKRYGANPEPYYDVRPKEIGWTAMVRAE